MTSRSDESARLREEILKQGRLIVVLPVFDEAGIDRPERMDVVIDHVVSPLIAAAEEVEFFGLSFSAKSFRGEGARLPSIIERRRHSHVLKPGVDAVSGFRTFWYGSDKFGQRGQVNFYLAETPTGIGSIFRHCLDPSILSGSDRGQAFTRARRYVQECPDGSVFCLDSAWLSSMVIFGGRNAILRLADGALSASVA